MKKLLTVLVFALVMGFAGESVAEERALTAEDWKAAGCNEAQTKIYMEGKTTITMPDGHSFTQDIWGGANNPSFLRRCKRGWAQAAPEGFSSIPPVRVPQSELYRAPAPSTYPQYDLNGNLLLDSNGFYRVAPMPNCHGQWCP